LLVFFLFFFVTFFFCLFVFFVFIAEFWPHSAPNQKKIFTSINISRIKSIDGPPIPSASSSGPGRLNGAALCAAMHLAARLATGTTAAIGAVPCIATPGSGDLDDAHPAWVAALEAAEAAVRAEFEPHDGCGRIDSPLGVDQGLEELENRFAGDAADGGASGKHSRQRAAMLARLVQKGVITCVVLLSLHILMMYVSLMYMYLCLASGK
jgi:hypothetical protein